MTYTLAQTRTTSPSGATTATGVSITPVNSGDLIVFVCTVSSTTIKATGISSSNTTGWAEVGSAVVGSNNTQSMFWGRTSGTSAATITPTYNGSILTANSVCWNLLIFHTTTGSPTWTLDTTSTKFVSSATTSLSNVTLAPTLAASELYVGMIAGQTGTNGSTSGYVYTALDLYTDIVAYNLNVTASTFYTATQSSGVYTASAAIFSDTAGGVTMAKPQSRNKARFRASFF